MAQVWVDLKTDPLKTLKTYSVLITLFKFNFIEDWLKHSTYEYEQSEQIIVVVRFGIDQFNTYNFDTVPRTAAEAHNLGWILDTDGCKL